METAFHGHADVIRLLLEAGATVIETKDVRYQQPLLQITIQPGYRYRDLLLHTELYRRPAYPQSFNNIASPYIATYNETYKCNIV